MPEPVIRPLGAGRFGIVDGTHRRLAYAVAAPGSTWVHLDGQVYVVESPPGADAARAAPAPGDDLLEAPMPATVVNVHVQRGQAVAPGDLLVTLEAMKMELPLRAPRAGRVASVACRPGDLVQPGVPLVVLDHGDEPVPGATA